MNSIKLLNRMDTIFMNSRNSKIFNPHRLVVKEVINMVLYQILTYTIHEKI